MPDYSDYGTSAYVSPSMAMALQNVRTAGPDKESIVAAMDSVEVAMALDDVGFDERMAALDREAEKARQKMNELGNHLRSLSEAAEKVQQRSKDQNARIEEALKTHALTDAFVAETLRRRNEGLARRRADQEG